MNRHTHGYRYIRVQDNYQREPSKAMIGHSSGWFPATVVEEANKDGEVLVKFHGTFDDPYGEDPEPVRSLHWLVPSGLVVERRVPAVTIDLSLVVVRWKFYHTGQHGSRSHNVLNEGLIKDVLDGRGSFKEFLGTKGNYEVVTIFASTSEHLDSIQISDLSGLRGQQKAALYFLWPTQKKAQERDGMVSAKALGSLMQRMEAAGIKTCWPHPFEPYYELVSKSWAPNECERLEFNIPPTTKVTKEEVSRQVPQEQAVAVASAATAAIERLQELSRKRGQTPRSKDRGSATGAHPVGTCGVQFKMFTRSQTDQDIQVQQKLFSK
eukprot:Skav222196  [mRNA]  locus=scaffold1745:64964:66392:- [translate_table: standard]